MPLAYGTVELLQSCLLNARQEDHPSRAKYTHDFTKAVGNMSEAAVGA
jgi:hypothetical protein